MWRRCSSSWWVALAALLPVLRLAGDARLVTLTNFSTFHASGSPGGPLVLISPPVLPGFSWRELVVSWNAASNVTLAVAARPLEPAGAPFLSLGQWAAVQGPDTPRTSVNGQNAAWGEVQTDVVVLRGTSAGAEVRLEIRGPLSGLRRLSLAFGSGDPPQIPGNHETVRTPAWGRSLSVPVRSQAEYPEGVTRWCSPTSTAMLMAYWGEQLGRPDWIVPVPVIAQAVDDPGWGGTGNWPFNMAFAGCQPGLNSAVARWESLADLESWIAAGLPAAASVSYAMLKGRPAAASGDGHLVVVRGFTPDGAVEVNDPGVRRERVMRRVPRADFERAWRHSGRTVYLIWPDGHPLPAGPGFPN